MNRPPNDVACASSIPWRTRLTELNFDKLAQEGNVDYVLLDNYLQHQIALLDRARTKCAARRSLLPFADRLLALQDTRRDLSPIDPHHDRRGRSRPSRNRSTVCAGSSKRRLAAAAAAGA